MKPKKKLKLQKSIIKNQILNFKHFIFFVVKHFIEDDCPYRASALAFTTLVAIVPLMSLSFSILSTFPIFQNLVDPIQDFIFANFVPSTGRVIQQYLQTFASQVTKLSTIGIIFLFVVAILVMYTIESAMNKIWRGSIARRGLPAFLLYWAIISLTPFLIGLSLLASSYILSIPFFVQHDAPEILKIIPFFFSLAGFSFLYIVVPNCHVRIDHGLIGGAITAILFESAKKFFALFLSYYNTYELLYGAFAAIPIFFMWVYWVWLITLLGAEITYALAMHHQRNKGPAIDGFSQVLLWLYKLKEAQVVGKSLSATELIESTSYPYEVGVGEMLNLLMGLQLISPTSDGKYVLSKDLSQLTLYDLLKILPFRPPEAENHLLKNNLWYKEIQKADQSLKKTLHTSLEKLFI